MYPKLFLIITIVLALFTITCSNSSTIGKCPDLGNVIFVENVDTVLNVDKLIGQKVPELKWDILDCDKFQKTGDSSSLSQFKGKPVIIVFHKTMNCPGCKAQLPFLQAAYTSLKDSGLTIITIYRGDKINQVKDYAINNKIEFLALADNDDGFAKRLGFPVGAPINVFIDRSGVIRNYKIGPLKSQQEIEEIIKSL